MTPRSTSARERTLDDRAAARVTQLLALAPRGLAAAHLPDEASFAHTVRGSVGPDGVRLQVEGKNPRYAAIAALGLSRLPEDRQREVLGGGTAAQIAAATAEQVADSADPGAAALALWADAEIGGSFADNLVGRLEAWLKEGEPLPTVETSWMVTAAVVAARLGSTDTLLEAGVTRLVAHRGERGIFPHVLPPESQRRWRAHVGSFADQVYPIQALARASAYTGRQDLLEVANRTARQICSLQGKHGQWWWHYDTRDGSVVERFPVYSVHQHAMGPMALFDLLEAGGDDHRSEIALGVSWLDTHPESVEELVSERWGLVWRKVGRREPGKAARAINAATTFVRPGAHLRGLDRLLPPGSVDYECRPYELGWLLYAWLPGGEDLG
jgi:hypothetical protein